MLAAKKLGNHDRFAHLRELLRSAKHTVKMRKGTFLFQEGMDAAELYLILSGKVQISKIGADGKEMCFRICGPGEIIGELTLFTAEPRYLLTAKVIEDGEVAAIKKDDLEQQLLTNPALAYEYMQWVSTHGGRKQNFAI